MEPMAADFAKDASVTAEQAKEHFAEVLDRAAKSKERVIVTRRGKPLAAIVPVDDVRFLEDLEERMDIDDAKAALEEAKREGTVSWSDLKKELGLG